MSAFYLMELLESAALMCLWCVVKARQSVFDSRKLGLAHLQSRCRQLSAPTPFNIPTYSIYRYLPVKSIHFYINQLVALYQAA